MNLIKRYLILFILSLNSKLVYSDIITLNHDLALPALITSNTDFVVDFGKPGGRLDVSDITVEATFSNNLWDPLESFTISYQGDPLLGWPRNSILTRTSTTTAAFTFGISDFNYITIDDDGLAFFRVSMGGGGAYFESLTLTANATISPVPIPPAIFLFFSGLACLRFTACRGAHITNRLSSPANNAGWTLRQKRASPLNSNVSC